MQNTIFTLITASLLCLATFSGCDKQSISKQYERLPELPQEIAATLDAKRMATKIPVSDPTPIKDPTITTAPCCSITDTMELQVRYPYTKCGPLRDFIVAPLADRVGLLGCGSCSSGTSSSASSGAPGGPAPSVADLKAFKLTRFNGQTVLDQHVCVTSSGPWKATLTIERRCNGYMPFNTLVINALGDAVQQSWSGGTEKHPPSIQLVSCRELSTSRSQCGGLSTCECPSFNCPATSPCNCTLPW